MSFLAVLVKSSKSIAKIAAKPPFRRRKNQDHHQSHHLDPQKRYQTSLENSSMDGTNIALPPFAQPKKGKSVLGGPLTLPTPLKPALKLSKPGLTPPKTSPNLPPKKRKKGCTNGGRCKCSIFVMPSILGQESKMLSIRNSQEKQTQTLDA